MLSLPMSKQPDGPLVTLARVRAPSLWQTQSCLVPTTAFGHNPRMASRIRSREDANPKFDPLHVEKQKNRAAKGSLTCQMDRNVFDRDRHASKQTPRTAAMRPQVGWIQTQVCEADKDGKDRRDSIRPGLFDRSRRSFARPRTAPAARGEFVRQEYGRKLERF